MTNSSTELLRIGVVAGSHGLRGELKLRGEDPDFSVLQEHDELLIQVTGSAPLACRIVRRSTVRGNLVVKLTGFDNVEAVQGLIGAAVLVEVNRLPALPQGAYYWHQLRGLRAIDKQDGDLGALSNLFTTAAHDIYVINGRYGEVLIPAVPQFITKIDLAAGQILFDLPEGLVSKPDDL
ncbi:ribosome maturation factor RimM [Syntrophotalea acetylenivorans]|uniref:ribosome maturation factor RimM n=1 Tax=Syntrophotalea acetylenivorans TaxID=1842532 RepID=UPI000931F973|nr:ribosome maturation factor RimM [Syntrophotalea acetylenivorans]